ncbi:MAG: DNA polymerase III subunit gamma/tau [Raoultibacter sp.]
MSEALYRKYRPQTFADVIGQDQIERTIRNALEQDKVSHAYLFCGPRGTGKTTTARLLAKALLCENGPTPDPDGTCDDCLEIAAGRHPDVYELDAASRTGVENVREEIIGRVQFAPTRGRCKVYIIDEVHMLSTAAFNALLKTLEEPPDHVVFILCTTDPQKVPDTIHSRCQRFDFRRIAADAMVSRLGAICVAEGVEFEGEALDLIAHRAEGGMRNALTSLEQVMAFGEGKVTLANAENMLGSLDCEDMAEIVMHIGKRDIAACFSWTAQYIETGADLAQFTRDFAEHVRDMYVLSLAGSDVVLEVSEATRREMIRELEFFGPERLTNLLGVLGDLSAELRVTTNSRLSFEIALTRMVRPDSDLTLASLADRIEALEAGHSAVAQVISIPAVANSGQDTQQTPAASQSAAAVLVPDTPPCPTTAAAPSASPVAAPQSKPAVAPASAQDASSVLQSLKTPASLQRIWQSSLTELKKTKPAYGVMFLNTKVTFSEADQGIVIAFSAGNSFAYLTVQKPDIVDELKRILRHVAGGEVAFRFVKEGEAVASKPAAQSSAAPAPQAPTAARPVPDTHPTAAAAHPVTQPAEPVVPAPDFDTVPLDAYDTLVSSASDDAPVPPRAAASPAANQDDFAALLAASFGEGVVFEEIDEGA